MAIHPPGLCDSVIDRRYCPTDNFPGRLPETTLEYGFSKNTADILFYCPLGPLEWREPKIDGRTEGDPTTEGSKKLNVVVLTDDNRDQRREKPERDIKKVWVVYDSMNDSPVQNWSLFWSPADVTFSGVGQRLDGILGHYPRVSTVVAVGKDQRPPV